VVKIIYRSKNGRSKFGKIISTNLSHHCKIELTYQGKPELLQEIMDVLEKYGSSERQSNNDKRGRGSVGRSLSVAKRYSEDPEYRDRRSKVGNIWVEKNGERIKERGRKRIIKLNEFANKRCKTCNSLLDHRTTSRYCRKHSRGAKKNAN